MIDSTNAEMATLGACIFSASAMERVRDILRPEHFNLRSHQEIYKAMLYLTQSGAPVDPVSLKQTLTKSGSFDDIGGENYLISLMETVPSASHATYYASEVLECHFKRDFLARALKIGEASKNGCTSQEIASMCLEAANLPLQNGSLTKYIGDADFEQEDRGSTTGWQWLDDQIDTAGYPRGQITLILADTGMGKSGFMMSSAMEIVLLGMNVGYVTLTDLGDKDITMRAVRNLCGFSKRPKDPSQIAAFEAGINRVKGFRKQYRIYDSSMMRGGKDIDSIVSWIRAEHNADPFDVVFIDYAQAMTTTDKRVSSEEVIYRMCSNRLQEQAKQFDIPMVLGSQITESKDGKVQPKACRALKDDAGWAIYLKREPNDAVSLVIEKSRFGESGHTIPWIWNPDFLRFEPTAQHQMTLSPRKEHKPVRYWANLEDYDPMSDTMD